MNTPIVASGSENNALLIVKWKAASKDKAMLSHGSSVKKSH